MNIFALSGDQDSSTVNKANKVDAPGGGGPDVVVVVVIPKAWG